MTRDEILRFLDACGFPHIKLFAILAITTAGAAARSWVSPGTALTSRAPESTSATRAAPELTKGVVVADELHSQGSP